MNVQKGKLGEDKAYEFLIDQGLQCVIRNYRNPLGEIDLIMTEEDILVFVEVKYRTTSKWGNPLESVDLQKQEKIKRIASWYLASCKTVPNCRFDVIGILNNQIIWVKGAFT